MGKKTATSVKKYKEQTKAADGVAMQNGMVQNLKQTKKIKLYTMDISFVRFTATMLRSRVFLFSFHEGCVVLAVQRKKC